MSVSRRQFILGTGAATIISARGFEAWAQDVASNDVVFAPAQSGKLILNSNENPMGPGQHVIDAVLEAIGEDGAGAGRYVFAQQGTTRQAIADSLGLERENILLGAGSSEMLRVAVEAYTDADRQYVTADPSFPGGERYAKLLGHPVTRVPLDGHYRLDLDALGDAAEGAGLVYVCNPNNPTATIHSGSDLRTFIETVVARSPDTRILIDEAYGEYVIDDRFRSMLSLVDDYPQIIVAKTFSKAYGMAGLRVGYAAAHADTIAHLSGVRGMDMYTSYPSRAGAIAALGDPGFIEHERTRNDGVRRFTTSFLSTAGVDFAASHTNFIFFDTGRPGEEFRQACLKEGVQVRAEYADYPTYARVSMGSMPEMERAAEVISSLL